MGAQESPIVIREILCLFAANPWIGSVSAPCVSAASPYKTSAISTARSFRIKQRWASTTPWGANVQTEVRGVANDRALGKVRRMSLTLDQIVEETRSLPHDVVSELVDRILLAAHGGQTDAHEKAWSETVHRRIEEIRSGEVRLVPGEEVSAKIRRIVGR